MTQGVLEQLVSRFNAAADGNCRYNNENLLFFRSRIGNRYIYSHSNIITSLVHWHDCCWFHWMMNFTVSSKYLVFLYEYIAYVLHYKDLSLIMKWSSFWAAAPEGTGGDASPMTQGDICTSVRPSVRPSVPPPARPKEPQARPQAPDARPQGPQTRP